jgi:putative endonuclease
LIKKKNLRKQIGNSGELRAQEYLKSKGYQILSTNFRNRFGEIDIICSKNDIIVFVEVKTFLTGNVELLQKVLNSQKQKRIVETAKYFLLNHRKYNNNLIRFDVVVIDMPELPPVYHIENAFSEF